MQLCSLYIIVKILLLLSVSSIQFAKSLFIRPPVTTLQKSHFHRLPTQLDIAGRMSAIYSEKDYTLIFCRRLSESGEGEVLLGMKRRGFGVGRWNGFGGKIEGEETIEEGAKRELVEESTIVANNLERRGFLVFKMLEAQKIMRVHVFDTYDFSGEAVETEEMSPRWVKETEMPLDEMWPDDKYWIDFMLKRKNFIGR